MRPGGHVEQAGGGMERQALYHDIHLLERTLRSLAQPAGTSPVEHPISPHLPWMLPVLLQVRRRCCHPFRNCSVHL